MLPSSDPTNMKDSSYGQNARLVQLEAVSVNDEYIPDITDNTTENLPISDLKTLGLGLWSVWRDPCRIVPPSLAT